MKVSEVLKKRSCGLKMVDHIRTHGLMSVVLKDCVELNNRQPDTWGKGWPNLHWAFANALSSVYKEMPIPRLRGYNGQFCCNLDEALTEEELKELAALTNTTDPFKRSWGRDPE